MEIMNKEIARIMKNGWLRIRILDIRLGKEANYDNKI